MRSLSGPVGVVIAATLVGAFLRLWNLEAAQFRGDDFVVSSIAIDIVQKGELPTGVLSSIGIANGPTAPLILAIPALVSTDHQWLSVAVGFLNIAMIPATYLLGRSLFGQRAGALAAVLTAVNPWLVIYGRRLWLNAFIGPTATLFLWALYWACCTNRLRAWALAGAAVAISAQIHLSSIPNLLAFASVVAFARRFPLKGIVSGAVCASAVLMPWIVLSLWPDLARFDWSGAKSIPTDAGVSSLERATIVATGVAYQSIAGQAGQLIDATAAPFTYFDTLARVLAVGGWGLLAFLAWRERHQKSHAAAVCLAMVAMVAAPTALLLRPAQAGQLPFLYPYYFINLIPPLLLGIAAFCALLSTLVRHLGTVLVGLIAIPQLVLAVPFFQTHEEFWPLGGYGVPWKNTRELVATTRSLAEREGAAIMVGGEEIEDSEQASVTARVLKRTYEPVRLYDSRDGLTYRTGERPVFELTTNDTHILARFLRQDFGRDEVFTQILSGAGWARRVFRVPPDEIENWAQGRLRLVPISSQTPGGVVYDRAGIVFGNQDFPELRLGVQWHFDADPPEPFLTDVTLYDGEAEVLRQVHVAYPALSWQRGDWSETRMLNLFELPPEYRPSERISVGFEHRGIITGKRISPAVRLGLTSESV